jgi:hypothetical protein
MVQPHDIRRGLFSSVSSRLTLAGVQSSRKTATSKQNQVSRTKFQIANRMAAWVQDLVLGSLKEISALGDD